MDITTRNPHPAPEHPAPSGAVTSVRPVGPRRSGHPGGRWLAASCVGAVMVVAAACGSSGSATTTTSSTPAPSSPSTTAGSRAGVATPAVVAVATRGSLGAILVDTAGMTLYRYTPDGTGKSVCTGACAAVWPPLTVPAGNRVVSGRTGVPAGSLGTITRPGGARQVTFDGQPLYTYVGDKAVGQTAGQGIEGTWFVVSPTPAAGSTSTTTTTAGSGGGSAGTGY